MDNDATPATSIFDQISSDYGGVATMEPPAEREAAQATGDPKPETKSKAESNPAPDDLLAPKEDGKKGDEKTPAQYAAERRERKERQRDLAGRAEEIERENLTLKQQYEEAQSKLKEFEELVGDKSRQTAAEEAEVSLLRERVKAAESRYVAAHAPQINPYDDDDVRRYATAVEDALQTNIPRFALDRKGAKQRIDMNVVRKSPERKAAMDQAVREYAVASETGDAEAMDRAVLLLGSALGDIDTDDDDVREKLDTALSKASDPFFKGVKRFKEVTENAATLAQNRRVEHIRETEAKLLAPLRFEASRVEEMLEKDPGHAWANFGALVQAVPEEVRDAVEEEILKDASVLGAMRYEAPPLPRDATSEMIENHEAVVRANSARALQAAQYLAVGRMMIDGGLLAHLRAKATEAEKRAEEAAGSVAIPHRGGSSDKKPDKGPGGLWDSIPSTYPR